MPIRKLKRARISSQFGNEQFFDEQGHTRVYDEAYRMYFEKVDPRRTQLIGKRAISEWKLIELIELQHTKKFVFRFALDIENWILYGGHDLIYKKYLKS